MKIPFDLEGFPLLIKTDSTFGSDDEIFVELHDKEDENSFFYLKLRWSLSDIQFALENCINTWTDLPTQPPNDVDKTWMFTKTSTALNISCNGVELLNYVFSDSGNSDCVSYWSRDVGYIRFPEQDKASDQYLAQPTGTSNTQLPQISNLQ